jgi:uncharacterized protein
MKNQFSLVALAFLLALAPAHAQETDLLEVAKTGTNQDMQAAISSGADVNAQDKSGWTALMYVAARNQDPQLITTLLKAGAALNARNRDGTTALMAAA